jgi:hypothetical protein
MQRSQPLLFLLLAVPGICGAAIYRCDTADGVVFSQVPCAKQGVQVRVTKPATAQEPSQAAAAVSAEPDHGAQWIDVGKFEHLAGSTPEVIVRQVGKPAASYLHDGIEHWLYPNAIKVLDNKRHCPELLLHAGASPQINWVPEGIMQKSVTIAEGFAGWKQPSKVIVKPFIVADTGVQGQSKSIVLRKLGEPDEKRVFNGREVWEYQKVRLVREKPKTVTVYLEFDGDLVVSAAGN